MAETTSDGNGNMSSRHVLPAESAPELEVSEAACNKMCNEPPVQRARSLENLREGRTEHGGWYLVRHGAMPAGLPWSEWVMEEIEQRQGEYLARCGGPDVAPQPAKIRIRQIGVAIGAQRSVEAWLCSKSSLTHPKHGRLPRAISQDWCRFAELERKLDDELRAFYVENVNRPPASPTEWLLAKQAEQDKKEMQ